MLIPTKFNKLKINNNSNNSNILLLALRSISKPISSSGLGGFNPIYFYFPNDTNISIFNNIIFEIYTLKNEEHTSYMSVNISELKIYSENNSFSNFDICLPHYYTEQDKNKIYIQYINKNYYRWPYGITTYKFKVYDKNN